MAIYGIASTEPIAVDGIDLVSEKAYRLLEEEMVTLRLAPGAIVSSADLAARIGLDLAAVREAVNRLSREGLCLRLPGDQIEVSAIDTHSQLHLLEIRRCVEGLAAALAAERATDAERARFRALDMSFRQVMLHEDQTVFLKLDRAFNQFLAEAARNPYCMTMLRMMEAPARRYFFHNRGALRVARTAELHSEIARSVAAGDPLGAREAVNTLLDYNTQHAVRSIESA